MNTTAAPAADHSGCFTAADWAAFPSLPKPAPDLIRMSGLTLTGMTNSLPGIVDNELRTAVFLDDVECELTWDLTDLTAAQADRMAEGFTALAAARRRTLK